MKIAVVLFLVLIFHQSVAAECPQPSGELVPIVATDPVYPRRAQVRGIEGFVDLEFTVTTAGTVIDPVVVDASPAGIFDRAALNAILTFMYAEQAMDTTGVQYRICFSLDNTDPNVSLFSSVLPVSRSVQVGTSATFFATMINGGSATATQCSIAPGEGSPPVVLSYRAADAANSPVGSPDTPVDIPPGGVQSFGVSIEPQSIFDATNVTLVFACENAEAATTITGVNTILLSSDTSPVADVIALAATVTNDGIAQLDPAAGSGFFSLSSINVGAAADINVSVDTGDATLPIAVALCQTDPSNGQCTNPAVPSSEAVLLPVSENETPTFAIFLTATDAIALDPANRRIFVRFRDAGGAIRGATSVAVLRPGG